MSNRFLPFLSMQDFKKVYALLTSNEPESIKQGVELVNELSKGHDEVLRELELSCALFTVKGKYLDPTQYNSCVEVIFDHRLALSQFHNYLKTLCCEENKENLVQLAEKLGTPSNTMSIIANVIDHPDDSSLQQYREALDCAISILDVHFWKAVPGKSTKWSLDGVVGYSLSLKTQINEYKNMMYENLNEGISIEDDTELNTVLNQIFSFLELCSSMFYLVLNEDDIFLSESDIGRLVSGGCVPELHCTCGSGDSTLLVSEDCAFLMDDSNVTHLPQIIIEFWMPLIKALLRRNCLQPFISRLAKGLKYNHNKNSRRLGLAWIYNMLLLGCGKATNTKLDTIVGINDIASDLDAAQLFFQAVEISTVNIFSVDLLRDLGEDLVVLAPRIVEIIEQNHELVSEKKDPNELLRNMKLNTKIFR